MSYWSGERVAILVALRTAGDSFGTIGGKMCVSRSAVAGKLRRLGLLVLSSNEVREKHRIEMRWSAIIKRHTKTFANAGTPTA